MAFDAAIAALFTTEVSETPQALGKKSASRDLLRMPVPPLL